MSSKIHASGADGAEITEELLVTRYAEAVEVFRLGEQATAAAKALKSQLKADGIPAADFMEFSKLRRQGKVTSRIARLKRLRAIAARFGEDDGQADIFVSGLSEKSLEALALVDAKQAGYDAGIAEQSSDCCPHTLGSEMDEAWRRSHADARAFLRGNGQSTADETPVDPRPRRSHLREAA